MTVAERLVLRLDRTLFVGGEVETAEFGGGLGISAEGGCQTIHCLKDVSPRGIQTLGR